MTEAFIVDAVRTPMGKIGGALSMVRPDDLAALVLEQLKDRSALDPALVEDVIFGNANGAGEDNVARGFSSGGSWRVGQSALRLRNGSRRASQSRNTER